MMNHRGTEGTENLRLVLCGEFRKAIRAHAL